MVNDKEPVRFRNLNLVPPECSQPQTESTARGIQNYRNPISELRVCLSNRPLF
jgi:hypothetical protein